MRLPFSRGRTWQLLQLAKLRATPVLVGTDRMDGIVPSGNDSAFVNVSGFLAAAITFGSNDRKCS
jgi:hypothetical protein